MFEEIIDYKNYSIEAEQAVVGAILLNNDLISDAVDIVQPESFCDVRHQEIFHFMSYLHENGQPCDVVTLLSALEAANKSEAAGGMAYLADLAQNTPSSQNMKAYAKVVLDKYKERKILELSKQMSDEICLSDEKSEDRINNALSLVAAIDLSEAKERSSDQVLKQLIDDIEERSKKTDGIVGLSTGFSDIDKRTSGLMDTDLIILAARPAMGKTTAAMNIARSTLDNGNGATLVFSMEMSADQLMTRMVSDAGNVALNKLRDGSLDANTDDWQRFAAGVQKMKSKNLVIDDRPALTPQQVRAKALRTKRKYGNIKLIVVDYLQLMQVNKSEGRTNDVGEISRSLKALAKEMLCPVIALSQLNRAVESRTDKRPMMSDLRESGAIEQDADIIWFLYRDEVYNGEQSQYQGIAELITSKFRNGEIGNDFLKSELHYSRFRDLINWVKPEEQTGKPKVAGFTQFQKAPK